MASGGQNQAYNNQSGSKNNVPAYMNMFSGAAQNYGNPAQQAFAPLMQQASNYNPFQSMSMFNSPFQQPNYNSAPSATAAPTTTPAPTVATAAPALNQAQINTIAGLPASGQPMLTTPPSPQSALPAPAPASNVNRAPNAVSGAYFFNGQSVTPTPITGNYAGSGYDLWDNKGKKIGQVGNLSGLSR